MQMNEAGLLHECETVAEANKLIAQGWALVAVLATGRPNGQTLPCYVLGRRAPMKGVPTLNPEAFNPQS